MYCFDCLAHLLTEGGACVSACSPGKMDKSGKCVPCDGPCPKSKSLTVLVNDCGGSCLAAYTTL